MKKVFGKRGFTLLELIVVIIIIGVLAVLGTTQYVSLIEKGRSAEAKSNLGTLRRLLMGYYQENGKAFNDTYINTATGLPITDAANPGYFYFYTITGNVTKATRCTNAGCKNPVTTAYNMTLDLDGTTGGSW